MSLATSGRTFELVLTPHDLRAPGFQALETRDGGVVGETAQIPVQTYKGTAEGVDGATVRASASEEGLEAVVLADTEQYYIEPARRYAASAGTDEYVVYKASDVHEAQPDSCGVTAAAKVSNAARQVAASAAPAGVSLPLGRVLEIATEADFEFVTAAGGAARANSQILSTLNLIEGLYERELGISFAITFQHAWTTNDPYTSTDALVLLTQFRQHWNTNFGSVRRDIAHLWTGKDTDSGGIAGGNCLGYGLTRGIRARTTAHEIGHNLGANHPDQQSPPVTECEGTLMQSFQAKLMTFCPYSRSEIAAFVTESMPCLAAAPSKCARLALSPSGGSALASGGPGAFTVDAPPDCSWSARSSAGWLAVASGGTRAGAGIVNYTASPNATGIARVGTITVGSRAFALTQDAASCASSLAPVAWWRAEGTTNDSAGQNHGALLETGTYGAGRIGRAFHFSSAAIFEEQFYAPTAGLPKGSKDRTVELWFSVEGYFGTATGKLASFETIQPGSTYFELSVSGNESGKVFFTSRSGDTIGSLTSSASFQLGRWHHLALTTQGATATMYLDGRLVAQGQAPVSIPENAVFLAGNQLKGSLDEISVYDRALSPAEIQRVFAGGKCGARLTLLTEHGSARAVAVDSVTLVRDPFPFTTRHNMSADRRTRVTLFATNLEPAAGGPAAVTAQAEDAQRRVFPLTVEYAGSVPHFPWLTQIVVRLPDGLSAGGDVWVSITQSGKVSNKALIRVTPAGSGAP
ncbi:MAG: M12 family metallo-peptidase [Acidobacteriota bacterium]|nr:M12 family metallo-peptidase [Acidobacteriota bacterium]